MMLFIIQGEWNSSGSKIYKNTINMLRYCLLVAKENACYLMILSQLASLIKLGSLFGLFRRHYCSRIETVKLRVACWKGGDKLDLIQDGYKLCYEKTMLVILNGNVLFRIVLLPPSSATIVYFGFFSVRSLDLDLDFALGKYQGPKSRSLDSLPTKAWDTFMQGFCNRRMSFQS